MIWIGIFMIVLILVLLVLCVRIVVKSSFGKGSGRGVNQFVGQAVVMDYMNQDKQKTVEHVIYMNEDERKGDDEGDDVSRFEG